MNNELKPGDTFESSEGFGLILSPEKVIILKPVPWGFTITTKEPPPVFALREGRSIDEPIRLAFDCVCEALGLPCT